MSEETANSLEVAVMTEAVVVARAMISANKVVLVWWSTS